MRRFIHIITVMAMAVSCSSKYEGTTIKIPEKMIKIENGAVSEYEYKPKGKPTLIIIMVKMNAPFVSRRH